MVKFQLDQVTDGRYGDRSERLNELRQQIVAETLVIEEPDEVLHMCKGGGWTKAIVYDLLARSVLQFSNIPSSDLQDFTPDEIHSTSFDGCLDVKWLKRLVPENLFEE